MRGFEEGKMLLAGGESNQDGLGVDQEVDTVIIVGLTVVVVVVVVVIVVFVVNLLV